MNSLYIYSICGIVIIILIVFFSMKEKNKQTKISFETAINISRLLFNDLKKNNYQLIFSNRFNDSYEIAVVTIDKFKKIQQLQPDLFKEKYRQQCSLSHLPTYIVVLHLQKIKQIRVLLFKQKLMKL